ncbi:hypothetical protein MGYG_04616 [Nannizzia gypsea CBS 118893]|uniref:Uncharacterized protein n=1 Tax=Arthroderma gypseum (strain ATCC MYA-4604 / CBS 118893) TaxID=535722 RepID=E4UU23_ARTGP|nr:hypothetical protein MGYG_04616 [Nannizzia gypsea CBS 118893]EFR01613.1 hypothetical protein MGYG_04616 [Nannizzia gypsea CBS 118893]
MPATCNAMHTTGPGDYWPYPFDMNDAVKLSLMSSSSYTLNFFPLGRDIHCTPQRLVASILVRMFHVRSLKWPPLTSPSNQEISLVRTVTIQD